MEQQLSRYFEILAMCYCVLRLKNENIIFERLGDTFSSLKMKRKTNRNFSEKAIAHKTK